ncbi:MAG: UDP-3-O-(3-hydroxymyristoyl)glucosamine N-acyltransferase [Burkholderiales bacterium]
MTGERGGEEREAPASGGERASGTHGQAAPAMAGLPICLSDLAARVGATLLGDGGVIVRRVGTLEGAAPDAIAFLSSAKYRPQLAATRAAAVIVAPGDADATSIPRLVHANPYATYARAATILYPAPAVRAGIDSTARVSPEAFVDSTACIGAYAVIGPGARIGPRASIGAHCSVGDEAVVGEDARLHPRVTLYPRCVIGARTIVHSGAVIGADGFGMANDVGTWIKIPQIGRAVVGEDCEIGANTTIDRGAIDDTVVEHDVKLDNQIQVGHNCRIGAHSAIAGCTGIAGSTTVGRGVLIGGAANIGGHLNIPDGTVISGASTVIGNVKARGVYMGLFPLMPQDEWRHAAVELRRIRALASRVAALERALREQQTGEGEAP